MMFCHLVIQMAEIPAGCFSASNSSTEGAHFQVHSGTGVGMPPAPMNEPLMESSSWQIRHNAYGQSNKDFKLQCSDHDPR